MPSLSDQAVLATSPSAALQAPDGELLARLRAGDTAAFTAMVDEWSPVMLRVARRYVQDRAAAEDVVQETWLGVVTGLARFEARGTVRSWAFSILINRAKSRRDRDVRAVPSSVLTGTEPSGSTVDPARFPGPDGDPPGTGPPPAHPAAGRSPSKRSWTGRSGRSSNERSNCCPNGSAWSWRCGT